MALEKSKFKSKVKKGLQKLKLGKETQQEKK